MARYTETIVAAVRQRYENTDQTIHSIAAELQIGSRSVQRMVTDYGWAKRSERVQGLPVAMQLLEEAKALGATPSERDAAPKEAPPTPNPSPPLAALAEGGEQEETPTPTLPLSGGGSPTAIERLEALVLQEIEAEEAARAQLGHKPRAATASERSARTLATLTQTLQALQRLRAGDAPDVGPIDDDDMPRDIDEFRRDLARRIDAFVTSRTDAADADGDCDLKPVDEAG